MQGTSGFRDHWTFLTLIYDMNGDAEIFGTCDIDNKIQPVVLPPNSEKDKTKLFEHV